MADLVGSGEAAKRLGVSRRSLARWVRAGLLEPDLKTPGGQYRWDVDRVRAEMREKRLTDN